MDERIASKVERLFDKQLKDWDLPAKNFCQLETVISRQIPLTGLTALLQFNPERIRSAAAKTDQKSLTERPCFLCAKNRPQQQDSVQFGDRYEILINPFPIFKKHLTIAATDHVDQRIFGRIQDMALLASCLPDYVLFYNGAKCGASAPDHMHFQAGNKGIIPLQLKIDTQESEKKRIKNVGEAVLYELRDSSVRCLIIESTNKESLELLFNEIYQAATALKPEESEPMMNILCWFSDNTWKMTVILRRAHRPRQFYAEGEENILISPASVEMGGLFVLAREKDYHKLKQKDLEDILDQTLITEQEINHLIGQL